MGTNSLSMFENFPPTKILITGAAGMLGSAFTKLIQEHLPRCELRALDRNQLDVTNRSSVMSNADWLHDGWIIHCAGLINVALCETNPEQAEQIIVNGTDYICDLAHATNSRVFYPQSFLIYDGEENPITETTSPNPLSRYGEFKLAAENIVKEKTKHSLRVCMGGFFGGDAKDKNFVGKIVPTILQRIKKGEKELEVGLRCWQPSYTVDLALNSLALMTKNHEGYYLMASHGEATFYDVASEVVKILNLPINIQKISSEEIAAREIGRRPEKAIMLNKRLQQDEMDMQRPWRVALREYLSHAYYQGLIREL